MDTLMWDRTKFYKHSFQKLRTGNGFHKTDGDIPGDSPNDWSLILSSWCSMGFPRRGLQSKEPICS